MKSISLFLALITFASSAAYSYEEEGIRGYISRGSATTIQQPEQFQNPLRAPGDRYRKFNLALDAIGIPHETAPWFLNQFPNASELNSSDVQTLLPIIDPDGGLRRYLSLTNNSVSLFQDFFSALIPQNLLEVGVGMTGAKNNDSQSLMNRLAQIAAQAKIPGNPHPLAGLKILIDPGHMGTPYWDEAGGKFVALNGMRVSEGQINLWTSMLAANELENLGATVLLTRTEDGAVSKVDPLTFDTTQFYNDYFYRSLDDWMAPYLNLSDSTLMSSIKNKPEVIKASSANQRMQYFIVGADLEARSQIIDRWQPDIVFDIHYDANQSDQLQGLYDLIEAFVPGGFHNADTGSRLKKSLALKHLLEVRRFNESVNLSSEIVQAMSKTEGLPLENIPVFLGSILVKDGVYARDLYISRRNLSALTVYLECLHYDHVKEFSKMATLDQVGNYHGISFHYPSRMKDVVAGIKQGFLNYFQH